MVQKNRFFLALTGLFFGIGILILISLILNFNKKISPELGKDSPSDSKSYACPMNLCFGQTKDEESSEDPVQETPALVQTEDEPETVTDSEPEIPENQEEKSSVPSPVVSDHSQKVKILKDVGEAYLDHLGLEDSDFQTIAQSKIDVIEGNFDICASDEDVRYFLNKSQEYGLKVILPAGSGEAEWGYECNQEPFPENQAPVWGKARVVNFVDRWKNHPALYAWDISNEAGSVFPNPSPQNMLAAEQIGQAYQDVKAADPDHPAMIRMNGWYFYDYDSDFFRQGNPFGKGLADIVMINAYSNVEDYFDDFVSTVSSRAISSLKKIDPNVKIVIALGAWEELPLWYLPRPSQFRTDLDQVTEFSDQVSGIGFFKYGATESEWYLPDETIGAPELLTLIREFSL